MGEESASQNTTEKHTVSGIYFTSADIDHPSRNQVLASKVAIGLSLLSWVASSRELRNEVTI